MLGDHPPARTAPVRVAETDGDETDGDGVGVRRCENGSWGEGQRRLASWLIDRLTKTRNTEMATVD
jgi:hypothetical protein